MLVRDINFVSCSALGKCILQRMGRFCAGLVDGGGVGVGGSGWDGQGRDDGVGEVVIPRVVAVEGGAFDIEERAMEQM